MESTLSDMEKLKYPIGKFVVPNTISVSHIAEWIATLEQLPQRLENLVSQLSDAQLDTVYRPGGWTVRQVVHHIPDSHHNSYIRFKWAMTEERPIIKAYDETAWANLFDAKTAPIEMSLNHLKAVHAKLVYFLRGLSRSDLQRTFIHPDGNVETPLDENIGRYAWHSNHHYEHINGLLRREGWG
tara:strand:- start:218 stop:769 length:552 start_codon:yes stop_codon:yes gene_type:complete